MSMKSVVIVSPRHYHSHFRAHQTTMEINFSTFRIENRHRKGREEDSCRAGDVFSLRFAEEKKNVH